MLVICARHRIHMHQPPRIVAQVVHCTKESSMGTSGAWNPAEIWSQQWDSEKSYIHTWRKDSLILIHSRETLRDCALPEETFCNSLQRPSKSKLGPRYVAAGMPCQFQSQKRKTGRGNVNSSPTPTLFHAHVKNRTMIIFLLSWKQWNSKYPVYKILPHQQSSSFVSDNRVIQ